MTLCCCRRVGRDCRQPIEIGRLGELGDPHRAEGNEESLADFRRVAAINSDRGSLGETVSAKLDWFGIAVRLNGRGLV